METGHFLVGALICYMGWEQVDGKKCMCLQDTLLVNVFLLEESHGQRSLVSYSPWDHTELDRTEVIRHVQEGGGEESGLRPRFFTLLTGC